ncbi:MAG TPA: hypothetical protein PLY93_09155 [Turneriella sp.]|nr:hypothetical protein [Turneriella sp.]
MQDTYKAVTRFADLDTQRHVTSRTYESMALEGRYRILAQAGFPFEKIQSEQIYLRPVSNYAKFHRQQFPAVELNVVTEVNPTTQGTLHWNQKVFEMNGSLVCHLQQETQTIQNGKPLVIPIESQPTEPVLYEKLPPWTGQCERIATYYTIPFAERDFAGKYNLASYWKIFEEGRWGFAEKTGLTYERIVELDTTSFYMGGIASFYTEIAAGRTIEILTWVERIDKIRYWFRQDLVLEGQVLASMRDEQLIVSLSRARPQRATPKFLTYMEKYVEFKPA